jgi:putative transcriptional regulator
MKSQKMRGGVVSVISKRFADELGDKRMRVAYLSAQTRTKLANQIRVLRSERGWSQGDFAKRLEKPQSNVSRLENREYGKFNLGTLFELASAFDVGLVVKFVPYEDFLRDTDDLNPEALKVSSFDKDALIELCDDAIAWPQVTFGDPIQMGANILAPQNFPAGLNALTFYVDDATNLLSARSSVEAQSKNWLSAFGFGTSSNALIHQVRLPSSQESEVAALRKALTESEHEKAALRAERDRIKAELDELRTQIQDSQTRQLERVGILPAYMIPQLP